jgi:hypothetical protein
MNQKILHPLFLILCLFSFAHSQQTPFTSNVSNVGTTAAAFLNIGVGSRAIAMGGAFTAIADGATALYWNPAGISRCQRPEVTFTHNDWFLDIYHEFVGAVLPVGRNSFGLSATYVGVPDQEVRTIAQPEGTGNFYNASDMMLGVSYAYEFTDRFAMGFTGKYIHQQIYNSTANAAAIDIGAVYQPSKIKWLSLGMQIANLGSDIQFKGRDMSIKVDTDQKNNSNSRLPASLDTDTFALPLIFRLGLAAKPIYNKSNKVIAAIDLIHPSNNTESINLGIEYEFHDFVALRAGYQSLFERDYQTTGGLCLGGGLKFYTKGILLILDYAWRDFGILHNVDRISCSIRF